MLRFDCKLPILFLLVSAPISLPAQSTTSTGAVTVAVSSSANPSIYAVPLTFTVKVAAPAASGQTPTGMVTATIPGPYTLGAAALDSTGKAVIIVPPPSSPLASPLPPWGLGTGANDIKFSYSGDNKYQAAGSVFTQWVNKANTTTTAAVTGNSLPVHFVATVSINEPGVTTIGFSLPGNLSSAPTGTVRFFNGTTLLGSATLTPSGLFTSTASMGSDPTPANLIAVYEGDDNYNPSTSLGTGTTGGGTAALKVTSSVNPSTFAQTVTLNIAATSSTTNGPIPTGTVAATLMGLFGLGTVALDAGGKASLDIPTNSISAIAAAPWGLAAGSDAITFTYNGDSHYSPAKTTFSETVNKATTTTTATRASSGIDTIAITATVKNSESSVTPLSFVLPGDNPGSSSPTGSVQFIRAGNVIGTVPLTPSGHLQSSAVWNVVVPMPTDGVTAVYAGDADYLGSTSAPTTPPSNGTVTIGVSSSANPSTFAEPVKFAITVAPAKSGGPTPTGIISATVQGSDKLASATLDSTGNASFAVPQDPGMLTVVPWGFATGQNIVTITYSGDATYAQSQSKFTQVVNKADTTTTMPLTPGAIGVLTAVVKINETSVSTFGFGIPTGGNVSTSPTGNVSFYYGTTLLGTAALVPGGLFQSSVSFHTSSTVATQTNVRAVYDGDTNYNGSSSPAIGPGNGPVDITLATSSNPVIYGGSFTVAATVTPATAGSPMPTGTVTFYDNGKGLGWIASLDSSGRGAMPVPIPLATPLVCAPNCLSPQAMALTAGSHTITVQYSGDANYAQTTPSASVTEQVNKAPSNTTLAEVSTGLFPSNGLSLIATVADGQPPTGGPYHFLIQGPSGLTDGNPTGTVQFFGGTTSIGTGPLSPDTSANVSSHASLNTNNTSATFSASYPGDANFEGSSSPTQSGPTVKLTSNPNPSAIGQTVALTATIVSSAASPLPTGSVDFMDGTTLLGKATISGGVATLGAAFSLVGTHTLTANYNGDANYSPASSAAYAQTVLPVSNPPGVLLLTSAGQTYVFGEKIIFIAQVQGTESVPPSGQIIFLDGATNIGQGTISLGAAELTVTLAVGTHQISAVWAGDSNWPSARSGILQVTVNRASTTTTLTSDLIITVTAVSPGAGTPSGTAQLIDSTTKTVLATVTLVNGTAKAPALPVNSSVVFQAAYTGDTNFAPSTSAILPTIYSAANVRTSTLAPDEIATIYGSNLDPTLVAPKVNVTDSSGSTQTAYLYYQSQGQINFVVPGGTATGPATVNVAGFAIPITVSPVVPVLYTANASGQGVAAGQIVRVHADNSQTIDNVAKLDQSSGQFQPAPIAFGSDSLYLVLYATGLRNRSSLNSVSCSVGTAILPVTYASGQSQFPGLDQVVVPLPSTLKGTGTVNVVVTADGQASNTVTIAFQ